MGRGSSPSGWEPLPYCHQNKTLPPSQSHAHREGSCSGLEAWRCSPPNVPGMQRCPGVFLSLLLRWALGPLGSGQGGMLGRAGRRVIIQRAPVQSRAGWGSFGSPGPSRSIRRKCSWEKSVPSPTSPQQQQQQSILLSLFSSETHAWSRSCQSRGTGPSAPSCPRTLSWAGCSPATARCPQPSPSFSHPGAVPSGSSLVFPTPVPLSRPGEDTGRFVRAKALSNITVRWGQMAWSIPREKRAGARAELCTQIHPVWAAPSPALLPPPPSFFFYLQISLRGDEK